MRRLIFVFAIGLLSQPSSATLITSAPAGGTTTTFPTGDQACEGASTRTVGGFVMSSNYQWCHDYSGSFGFHLNGYWVDFGLVGDNSGVTTITIDLGGLQSAVGGFMNYDSSTAYSPTISALAADGTVLESFDLTDPMNGAPISTGGALNGGAFRGIQRDSADIRFLQIGGSFLAMHDITLVPEPSTLLLLGSGIAGLVSLGRTKRG